MTGVDVQEAISRAHRALEALLTVARDTATSSESAAVAARETVWAATAARAADERDRQAQRALGVTAPDAELVALRIGGNHPSAAVWPALVVDHPGTDAQELADVFVASAREQREIKTYPVLDVPGLRHGEEQQGQRSVRREQQSLRIVGSVAVVRVFAEPRSAITRTAPGGRDQRSRR